MADLTPPVAGTDDPDEMPPLVREKFAALMDAMKAPNHSVALVRIKVRDDGPYHYICASIDGMGEATPLAVIPSSVSMFRYLKAVESAGVILDPDFMGVIM
jgi:hypothetical protein